MLLHRWHQKAGLTLSCCMPRSTNQYHRRRANIAAASIMDPAKEYRRCPPFHLRANRVMKVIFLWLPWSVGLPRQYVASGYRAGQVNKTLAVWRSQGPFERGSASHEDQRSSILQRRPRSSRGLRVTIQTEIAFLAASPSGVWEWNSPRIEPSPWAERCNEFYYCTGNECRIEWRLWPLKT